MSKVVEFVKRHPKVYSKYMSLVVFMMSVLATLLNRSMLHYIHLKGLNPNAPPPPEPVAPPEPTFEDAMQTKPERKQIQIPYVPSWVAASFKNKNKHPLLNVPRVASDYRKETKVEQVEEVQPQDVLEVTVISVAQDTDNLEDSNEVSEQIFH